jgi:anti-anti-sigma regulatory factor
VTAKAAPAKKAPAKAVATKAAAPAPAPQPAVVERPAVIETAPVSEVPAPAPKKSKTARYVLPTNMEIAALGPVHADLLAMESSNDGPFVLDGAQLSVIDVAGLQLLISFVSTLKAGGKKVSWDNYSVQAYQLANELGVVDQIGD